jgi:hypothetical protein
MEFFRWGQVFKQIDLYIHTTNEDNDKNQIKPYLVLDICYFIGE